MTLDKISKHYHVLYETDNFLASNPKLGGDWDMDKVLDFINNIYDADVEGCVKTFLNELDEHYERGRYEG